MTAARSHNVCVSDTSVQHQVRVAELYLAPEDGRWDDPSTRSQLVELEKRDL
jgi:hypothetical protein